MLRSRVISHGYTELRLRYVVQWEAVLICDRLPFVFMLSDDDTASTKGERGASRLWSTDDFVWCRWCALSAYTVIHGVGDALVQRECVFGWEIVAESGQCGCGAFVESSLVTLDTLCVFTCCSFMSRKPSAFRRDALILSASPCILRTR